MAQPPRRPTDIESIGRQMAIAAGVNPDSPQQLDVFISKFAKHFKKLEDAEAKEEAAKKRPFWFGFTIIGGGISIIFTAIVATLMPEAIASIIAHLPWRGPTK